MDSRLLVKQYVRCVGWLQALEVVERRLGHETIVELVPILLGVAGVREVVPVIHAVTGVHDRGVQVIGLGRGAGDRSRDRQPDGIVVRHFVAEFRPQSRVEVVSEVFQRQHQVRGRLQNRDDSLGVAQFRALVASILVLPRQLLRREIVVDEVLNGDLLILLDLLGEAELQVAKFVRVARTGVALGALIRDLTLAAQDSMNEGGVGACLLAAYGLYAAVRRIRVGIAESLSELFTSCKVR